MVKKKADGDQLTLSGSEGEILARLYERVEKAISMIHDLRRERDALKARLHEIEGRVKKHDVDTNRLVELEEDHDRFQKERAEIRKRIESILSNLESLDASE
jgi:FtsZ-binding cell division protein ZapB